MNISIVDNSYCGTCGHILAAQAIEVRDQDRKGEVVIATLFLCAICGTSRTSGG